MKGIYKSFPVAVRMILTDPVNLVLAIIPTFIALGIYIFTIASVYRSSDRFVSFFRGYIYTADQATLLAKILTAILIIFMFFIMSWTFIIVVGIISAPFNSLLSARVEQKLLQRTIMDGNQKNAMTEVKRSLGATFKNEFKKLGVILAVAAVALILNAVPLFYPIAAFLIATLLSVQFIDYSWSRHNLPFSACLKDTLRNVLPYFVSGAIFLALIAVPLLNAVIPALATSYYTVLWLYRHGKIEL